MELVISLTLILCIAIFALDSLGVLTWQWALAVLGFVALVSMVWLVWEAAHAPTRKDDE